MRVLEGPLTVKLNKNDLVVLLKCACAYLGVARVSQGCRSMHDIALR